MIRSDRVQSLSVDYVVADPRRADAMQAPPVDRSGRARVLVASPQPIVRFGVRALLTMEADLEVIAEAEDGTTAVALARQLRPAAPSWLS
jgi:hypothetical protein